MTSDALAGDEAYELTWVGKKQAMAEVGKPIRKTLRPVKGDSKDWDNTKNIYIEGDNLEALKLLHESYRNKVKMIYIDPPYNTGKDFVYPDSFIMSQDDYDEGTTRVDEDGNVNFKENTVTNPRFHSDWCSRIYPRLILARNLLTEDGVIFISIDDNEQENLKKICDEVFGASNFLGTFVVNSTPNARDYGHIGKMHEFVLFYSKNALETRTNMLPEVDKTFKYTDSKGGYNIHPLYNSNEAFTNLNRPNLYYPFYLYLNEKIETDFYNIGLEPKEGSIKIFPPKSLKNGVQFVWRWGKEKALDNINEEIIGYKTGNEYRIVQKMRHSEKIIRSLLLDTKYSSRRGTAEVEELFDAKCFSFPKPEALLHDLAKVATDQDSIVLDFFSGSATTAHAVMQLNAEDGGNRKFIMVQWPEVTDEKSEAYNGYKNICEIGKERIRRAGKKIDEENQMTAPNLDTGFRVFRIDDTNMKDVYYSAGDYTQNLLDQMESNIKDGRTDLDLLYSCLIEWGLTLDLPHKCEVWSEQSGVAVLVNNSQPNYHNSKLYKVHTVNEGDLIACFEENVSESVIREIANRKPLRAVFRDSSFASSPAKINVYEIFKLLAPNAKVKVL